eukprot:gb/GECG01012897.1/.p1 GENE.gb/GECG01012897.1/~~gb/GECG01012897.1/.p1  ORF type:complete len:100 (+),score=16.61 gb/GECG01012897.1/:1-300(+)
MTMSSRKRGRSDEGIAHETHVHKDSKQQATVHVDEDNSDATPRASSSSSTVTKQASNGSKQGGPNEFQLLTQDALEAVIRYVFLKAIEQMNEPNACTQV